MVAVKWQNGGSKVELFAHNNKKTALRAVFTAFWGCL